MSFINKLKDATTKAGAAASSEYKKQQKKSAERKELKAQQLAEEQERIAQFAADEEARKQKILSGDLVPITVSMGLQAGEKAYLELQANRSATTENIIEETTGKTKKKHVVGRALVGGVLLGPLGALGGAATSGSKNTSVTTQRTELSTKLIDSGRMILTNQRFIFVGSTNVVAIPYAEVMSVDFSGNQARIKYVGMLDGESYTFTGPSNMETGLYYKGIIRNLVKPENQT